MISLGYFKDFMRLRGTHPLFDEVKTKDGVGMPCVKLENGEWTLEWEGVEKD